MLGAQLESSRRLLSSLTIALLAVLFLGCSITYKGTGGDLTIDGRPVSKNIIERDDLRLAIVYRPLITEISEKAMGIFGSEELYQPAFQHIVFIFEATSGPLEIGFLDLLLNADCQEGIEASRVRSARDDRAIREQLSAIKDERDRSPDFDPLTTVHYWEEYPVTNPGEGAEIVLNSSMSCQTGELMLFELIYPLPACYKITEPMTLVLTEMWVGGNRSTRL